MRLCFLGSTVCAAALVCITASATAGVAPEANASDASETAQSATRPPSAALVGTKLAWRSGGAPRLLWTGFRATPEGGEVLIQTSAAVELEQRPGVSESGDSSLFVLKHCRSGRRVDQLPLDTRFFRSPVTGVSVRARASDLEIAVALRQRVAAAPRKEAGPGGSWFWVIRFSAADGSQMTTAAATR
jgi:hypothetical protein